MQESCTGCKRRENIIWIIVGASAVYLGLVFGLSSKDAGLWQARSEECVRTAKQLAETADKINERLYKLCRVSK